MGGNYSCYDSDLDRHSYIFLSGVGLSVRDVLARLSGEMDATRSTICTDGRDFPTVSITGSDLFRVVADKGYHWTLVL